MENIDSVVSPMEMNTFLIESEKMTRFLSGNRR